VNFAGFCMPFAVLMTPTEQSNMQNDTPPSDQYRSLRAGLATTNQMVGQPAVDLPLLLDVLLDLRVPAPHRSHDTNNERQTDRCQSCNKGIASGGDGPTPPGVVEDVSACLFAVE
jgi:hypothetical protein